MQRRIVITGLGLLSPAGPGPRAFADAVAAGRSVVRRVSRFDPSHYPSQVAGEVAEFDPAAGIRKDQSRYVKKMSKVMARDIQMAVAAANQAILDTGLPVGDAAAKEPVLPTIDHARFGLVFGTNFIPTECEDLLGPAKASMRDGEFSLLGWGESGIPQMFPLWLLKYLPNMHTCHTGILWDAQGASNSLTCGDSGGLLALDECCRLIRRDIVDLMVAGGSESRVNPTSMMRQCLLERGATTRGDPAEASRPFDAGQTGSAIAEGAAAVVLEAEEAASARGARVLAEVLGCGSSVTTAGVNTCDPDGRATRLAVEAALDAAGIEPAELGAVVAHGAALRPQDRSEARGLAAALGQARRRVPVTAFKGVTGNMGAPSGLAEIGAVLAMADGRVPPIVNCTEPDPEVDLDLVIGEARPLEKDLVLFSTLAVGGQSAATIVRLNR